jgi:hypothetical protein
VGGACIQGAVPGEVSTEMQEEEEEEEEEKVDI